MSAVAQFPFLTIVQTYFLQPASGSKVQGERWAPGSNFARVSPGTTASLPANLLLHCLHLACSSCLLVTYLHGAFWLLDPCFLSCIFACFVPAICWCRHRRPILPLATFSNLHCCRHSYQPFAMVSHDDYQAVSYSLSVIVIERSAFPGLLFRLLFQMLLL